MPAMRCRRYWTICLKTSLGKIVNRRNLCHALPAHGVLLSYWFLSEVLMITQPIVNGEQSGAKDYAARIAPIYAARIAVRTGRSVVV